ncbi:putative ribonuclease H-like domain, reverse transcriptase zinc-binding domain-containing protein [Senna tora]|uniref:Putative ribonuclease H-like domain, reverse transcriptase zinc-binding domain-containing protein n=1 Tax=Senna tora TaxID=362788 RepID=A0A834W5Q9_9FABA|nr:putative ribonuclease H-like domain, reverse transcriptase zinc-binding domain-containing protein [Senna tora]
MGNRPSTTWRALMAGRTLLKSGLRRSIGDGKSMQIWEDPWVLFERPTILPAPSQNGAGVEKVCDLMNGRGDSWNEKVLRRYFDEVFANAYCAFLQTEYKGIIPTMDALEHRAQDFIMPMCLMVVEANKWRDEQLCKLAEAMYCAWERRNAKKFSNEMIKADALWRRVERIMEEFQAATLNDANNIAVPTRLEWEKPECPLVKLNVDAASSKDCGGAIGGLIRDLDGCV